MPTVTLVPTSLTDTQSNVAAGAYTDIDNTIASASGTTLDSVVNVWSPDAGVGSAFSFGLSDLPSGAYAVNKVRFRVRARITGTRVEESAVYRCAVDGTNAPTTTARWFDYEAGNAFKNKGQLSMVTTSATPAQINSWTVKVYQEEMEYGDEGLNFEIDEIEIIVDYEGEPPQGPGGSPDATNSYTVIPTTDTVISGLCVTTARDFVVLGGLDTDRYAIRWCAIGDPSDWPTPATDDARAKQAGSQTFPTRFGNVTGLVGNDFYMYIFQEKAVSKGTYVGGDTVWSFDIFEEDRGCIRQGRLIAVDDRVFFQSARGYHMLMNDQITDIGFGSVSDSFA